MVTRKRQRSRMIANYHTHTRWCGHGAGEIEDYVAYAARIGLEELAITEHVPLPGDPYPGDRMKVSEFPVFDAELNRVIDKYRGKIRVRKGLECEYYPYMLETYKEYKKQYGYEILILGQHLNIAQTLDNFYLREPWQLSVYAEEVCEGLESGLFDFLAHPDLVIYGYKKVDAPMLETMERIFATCKKLNIPAEVNAGGIRYSRGYPDREIWRLAHDCDIPCIVGVDAHNVQDLDGWCIARCKDFVAELGLRPIERLPG